jgi:hypothetical protein
MLRGVTMPFADADCAAACGAGAWRVGQCTGLPYRTVRGGVRARHTLLYC